MKYDYSVKVNGKWYQPNEKIPDEAGNNRKNHRGSDQK